MKYQKVSLHPMRVFGKNSNHNGFIVGTAFANFIRANNRKKLRLFVQIKDKIDHVTVIETYMVMLPVEGVLELFFKAGLIKEKPDTKRSSSSRWVVVESWGDTDKVKKRGAS